MANRIQTHVDHQHDHQIELLKSVVSSGESVLKTLLLINGGATVAVLAFLGNVLTKEPPKGVVLEIPKFATGLSRFTAAVVCIGAAAVFRFLSIWFARNKPQRLEMPLALLALAGGVASLVLFVCGSMWVVGGMH